MIPCRAGCRLSSWENALIITVIALAAVDFFVLLLRQVSWGQISGSLFSLPPVLARSPGVLIGHPNLMAGYINLALPILLLRVLQAKGRGRRAAGFLLLAWLALVEVLTHSRSGWLGLAAGLAVALILVYLPQLIGWLRQPAGSLRALQGRRAWIAVLLLGAAAFIALSIFIAPRVGHGTVEARLDIWRYAWQAITEQPLAGMGTGAMTVAYAGRAQALGGDEVYHAHNIWLSLGLELGVLGVLLAITIGVLVFVAGLRAWRTAPAEGAARVRLAAYAGALTSVLVHGMLDYLLWQPVYIVGVLLVVGLVLRLASPFHELSIKPGYLLPVLALLLVLLVGGRAYLVRSASSLRRGRRGRLSGAMGAGAGGDLRPGGRNPRRHLLHPPMQPGDCVLGLPFRRYGRPANGRRAGTAGAGCRSVLVHALGQPGILSVAVRGTLRSGHIAAPGGRDGAQPGALVVEPGLDGGAARREPVCAGALPGRPLPGPLSG